MKFEAVPRRPSRKPASRSKRTLKLVRNNFDEAQKNFEKQTTEFEFEKLPEMVRTQLRSIEGEVRKAVVAVAKSFDIATTSEVDALRRKLSNLEKRVSELRRGKRCRLTSASR